MNLLVKAAGIQLQVSCLFAILTVISGERISAQVDNQFVVELQRFERQFHNRVFDYTNKYTYLSGPVWEPGTVWRTSRGFIKNWDMEYWHSEERYDHAHIAYTLDATEEYVKMASSGDIPKVISLQLAYVRTPEFQVNSHRSSEWGASGYLKSNPDKPLPHIDHMLFVFGYDQYLVHGSITFSQLLKDFPSSRTQTNLHGIDSTLITCRTDYGMLRLWFSTDDSRVLQIEMHRGPDDYYRAVDTELSDNANKRKYRLSNYETSYRLRRAYLREHITKYQNIEYREIDGQRFCVGYVVDLTQRCVNDLEDRMLFEYAISNVRPVSPSEKKPKLGELKFTFVDKIPDGTRFTAWDDRQVPYVIKDNVIHRVVNESVLATLEGERFPWTRGGINYYLVFAIVICFVLLIGIIIYRFRNRRAHF
ncbi:MAG TPA: hypothetical protein PKD64_14060 [Pirellulaceae bacterium]|nr:hypothetical protein [Pirellulaceae bacterium]HMO93312.1 hypothetical protein [Pirellulaceae bacterium]HMP69149.1 hypothetical protein [Pirellulaceae bacterium]